MGGRHRVRSHEPPIACHADTSQRTIHQFCRTESATMNLGESIIGLQHSYSASLGNLVATLRRLRLWVAATGRAAMGLRKWWRMFHVAPSLLPGCPRDAPRLAPGWHQVGSRSAPGDSRIGPRRSQVSPCRCQVCSRGATRSASRSSTSMHHAAPGTFRVGCRPLPGRSRVAPQVAPIHSCTKKQSFDLLTLASLASSLVTSINHFHHFRIIP